MGADDDGYLYCLHRNAAGFYDTIGSNVGAGGQHNETALGLTLVQDVADVLKGSSKLAIVQDVAGVTSLGGLLLEAPPRPVPDDASLPRILAQDSKVLHQTGATTTATTTTTTTTTKHTHGTRSA